MHSPFMPHVNVGICKVLSKSHLRLLKKLPAIIWFGKLLPLLQNAKLQECISMKAMPKTGQQSENAREPLRIVSFRGQSGLCPSGSRGGGPHASRDVCSTWSHKATVGCRLFFYVQAGELVYGPPDVWHVALALEEMGHDGTAAWYPALIEPRNMSDGRTRFAVANRWSTKVTFSALYRLAMDHGSQSQWPFTFVHQLTGWRAELWTILCLPGLPGAGPGRTWVPHGSPHGSHMGPSCCVSPSRLEGWQEALARAHGAALSFTLFAHICSWTSLMMLDLDDLFGISVQTSEYILEWRM